VIPCVIIGTNKAMPIHKSFFLLPTPLRMIFMPPVSPEGLTGREMKEKVYDQMLHKLIEENK
jgi:hypothetical protein